MKLFRPFCLVAILALPLFGQQSTNEIASADDLLAAVLGVGGDSERSTLLQRYSQWVSESMRAKALAVGTAGYNSGDFDRALAGYSAALQIAIHLGDQLHAAVAYNDVGITYAAKGTYARALEPLQRAYRYYESVHSLGDMADTLENIATVYRWQLDFETAVPVHQQALRLAEELGDKYRIGVVCINIGFIRVEEGRLDEAMQYLERGLALMKETGRDRAAAMALVGIANLNTRRKVYDAALAALQEALQLQEKTQDRYGMATTLSSIAYAEAQMDRFEAAAADGERALSLAKAGGFREAEWRSATTLGFALIALKQYESAEKSFASAIATIEEMRQDLLGDEGAQQRFFSDKLDPYRGMVWVLALVGRSWDALRFAELTKARQLLDVAHSGRTRIDKVLSEAERSRESELGAALVSANRRWRKESANPALPPARRTGLEQTRDGARLAYERYQLELYAAHPELRIRRGEVEWQGRETTARNLNNDTAVIEFAVTKSFLFAFILYREADGTLGMRSWFRGKEESDLAAQVAAFRDQLAQRNLAVRTSAQVLFDLLLGHAQETWARKKFLVIIPDGVLWELPFQALEHNGRYVIEDSTVLYLPSLAVLNATAGFGQHSPAANLLAIGLPLGQPLPGGTGMSETERQVRSISALYGPGRSLALTGAGATEQNVRKLAGNYSIVHFATHAVRDEASPMHSHLVLHPSPPGAHEDGLLEAWELMDLGLRARLVVLSACETARGKVANGEGMIGLTWALLIGGTSTVVSSQWQVPARSTTDLMVGMHRGLQKSELTALQTAAALRASALRLLHTAAYNHPFNWAGFVTVGTHL